MNRIVIATDGSVNAWPAVEDGVQLAFEVGASVIFVYVRHPVPLLGDPWYQRHLTHQFEQARDALAMAEVEAERIGVPYESEILEGDPAECIVNAGVYRDADLLVVGSRGRGTLASTLIGSVSREVTERSSVPVMVVREQAAARSHAA
jgi:nucleotide-binding universal stress UspA family protein